MKANLSVIERLDLVARSSVDAVLISRLRLFLLFLTPFVILLAAYSTAPFRETVLVTIVAAASLLTTVMLWFDWRYKVYAPAILFFTFALAGVLSHDNESHTLLVRAFLLLFVYYGIAWWKVADRYALINGNDFHEDKNQFDKWLQILNSHAGANVIEFSAGGFSTGYWTYRILNPGTCWIVAQFKRGGRRLKSCRAYELSDLTFNRLPPGSWQIDITTEKGKQSFVGVEITPPVPLGLDQAAPSANV